MKIRLSKKMLTKNFSSNVFMVLTAIVIALIVPLQITQRAYATPVQDAIDEYNQQTQILQQEVDNYTAEAVKLKNQANTLQSAVAELQNQAAVIQAQIDISQAKYNKLVLQIADTEKQIKNNQDALGKTIANMYVDDQVTPLEMLASSKNVGDYLDKQEYRSSIRSQLAGTITKIKDLKTQLDKQQADVKTTLDTQQAQKAGLVATQNQQQDLLDKTQGQEAAYQQLVASKKAKMDEAAALLSAKIAQYGAAGNGNVGIGGGGGYVGPPPLGAFGYRYLTSNQNCPAGGYPYCGALDSYADPYQLFNRECVSYAAWAADVTYGKKVYGFMGMGMAYELAHTAETYMDATVNNTPAVGAIAILPPLPGFAEVGHAMIVDSIVDSEWVHVSQYNFGSTGQYSEMDIRSTGVVYIHFQND